MRYIEESTEFFVVVNGENLSCIMFTNGLLQCKVMERILGDICDDLSIEFYLSDVSNVKLGKAYTAFGVGALPKYFFVRGGEVIYSDFGFVRKSDLSSNIQKRI